MCSSRRVNQTGSGTFRLLAVPVGLSANTLQETTEKVMTKHSLFFVFFLRAPAVCFLFCRVVPARQLHSASAAIQRLIRPGESSPHRLKKHTLHLAGSDCDCPSHRWDLGLSDTSCFSIWGPALP